MQPHSGSNANLAAYMAVLDPGDTVMGMSLDHGGHLTHGSPVNVSGRLYEFVSYGVTPSDERIDYSAVAETATQTKPKMIIAGATAYPRIIDPEPLRRIADEVGALLMFDAAHIAGLIAGGAHPNPVGIADIVTLTTHKTLRGPRGGMILCRGDLAKAIDKAVFPGTQGRPSGACSCRQSDRVCGGVGAGVRHLRGLDCRERRCPGQGAIERWLQAGFGRHGQPSLADRPQALPMKNSQGRSLKTPWI